MPASKARSATRISPSSQPAVQRLVAEGIDARGPLLGRQHVPSGGARELRRRAGDVSRPGADPDQDARLRPRGQRHARPAVRAHLARSRHRLRHRRHRPRRSVKPDRRAQARGAATSKRARAHAHERDRRPPAAARGDPTARSARQKIARPELPARSQSHRPHRPRRRSARRRDRARDRSRPRRAHPRAARQRRQARRRDRARRPRDRRACGNRRALSRAASTSSPPMRSSFDPRTLLGGGARAHRRQPALQHRDRAAGRLADRRAMAAVVRPAGADVPARGRGTHHRGARLQDLRPAVGAGRLAHRGAHPVRHRAVRVRAAAEGDLVAGRAGSAPRAAALPIRSRCKR